MAGRRRSQSRVFQCHELGSTVCFLVSESLEPPGVLASSPACPWPPPCPCHPGSRPLTIRQSSVRFRNMGPAPLTELRVLGPPTSSGAWACGEWPWTCGLRASIFCHSGCHLPDSAAPLGIPLSCLVGSRKVGGREIENGFPGFSQAFSQKIRAFGLVLYVADISNHLKHWRSFVFSAGVRLLCLCVLYSHSQRVQKLA